MTCEPRCGFLVFFLSPPHKIRLQSLPCCSYPPMGNLCGSAATVPSEPQSGPPVAELRPSTPDSLQLGPNVKEEYSVPSSSRSLSRPRCHSSASQRLSTQQSGRSSQDPTPRSRTKSAPHPPQTFKPSSPQDPRSRLVVQSKSSRSDPRPTSPGETIIESGP